MDEEKAWMNALNEEQLQLRILSNGFLTEQNKLG
jgi:hypothetical protein